MLEEITSNGRRLNLYGAYDIRHTNYLSSFDRY
jgi:hypothetical protein